MDLEQAEEVAPPGRELAERRVPRLRDGGPRPPRGGLGLGHRLPDLEIGLLEQAPDPRLVEPAEEPPRALGP